MTSIATKLRVSVRRKLKQLDIAVRNRSDALFAPFRSSLAEVDAVPQLALLGLVSGLVTGLLIVLFRTSFEVPLEFLLSSSDPENFESLSVAARMIFPLVGAGFVGLLLFRLNIHHRKVGVTHVLERLGYHQGYLSLRNGLLQFVVGAATIISGQSAGREGPAVHLGATVSSLLGQWAALPNNSIRMLVGCGTAAAISASFNTPLAGIIFAMEVVLMEYTIIGFTPIILAAVSAAVVTQYFYGNEPAFVVPDFGFQSLLEVPLILLATVPLALAAFCFNQTILTIGKRIKWSILTRLMLAGFLTGVTAISFPQIMGVGYDSVNGALVGEFTALSLLAIGLAKLFMTGISIGLGMPIGIIGPTLFIGACLGGSLGVAAQTLMPNIASDPGFYALLGMGAMMGAVLQAPLAAIMAVVELTRTTGIILPAMLMIIITGLLTRNVFKQKPVFVAMLQAQGLDYRFEPLTQALRRVSVAAIMERRFIRTNADHTLDEARQLLKNSPIWILIEDKSGPLSLMPAVDLARYIELLDEESSKPAEEAETDQIEGAVVEPIASASDSPAAGRAEGSAEEAFRDASSGGSSAGREEDPVSNSTPSADARVEPEQAEVVLIKVNLLKIPAKRRDLAPLHMQATLEEALNALRSSNVEALFIQRSSAPMIRPIVGIITQADIVNYYSSK